MKSTINDEAVKQALDLISEKHTDLSEIFSEDGLLKQLTKGLVVNCAHLFRQLLPNLGI